MINFDNTRVNVSSHIRALIFIPDNSGCVVTDCLIKCFCYSLIFVGVNMNIFILSADPALAARFAFDSHVVKMPLESLQILCTNARILGHSHDDMMISTHQRHPSTIWARESAHNFSWLVAHCEALFIEYTRRYKRIHASQSRFESLLPIFDRCIDDLEHDGKVDLTPFALAMPDDCRMPCSVDSYRKYYAYKAQQEIDKLITYHHLIKRGQSLRKPALRFVWQRAEKPDWATFPVASHVV